jgi:dolichol-phosphate mannosyltransferase
MTDPLSGFFAIKKDAFLEIRNKLQPDGFKVMLEIAYQLINAEKKYNICETPINFRLRAQGESNMNSKVLIALLRMIYKLKFRN